MRRHVDVQQVDKWIPGNKQQMRKAKAINATHIYEADERDSAEGILSYAMFIHVTRFTQIGRTQNGKTLWAFSKAL